MQAWILRHYGGADGLALAEIARPAVGADEVLVQVHAAGVNPIDTMIPKGDFKPILKLRLPAVMGSDLAGVVVETGARVARFKKGDAVFGSVFDMPTGSFAELVAVPEQALAAKPDNIDFVQAASLPMVSLTAWQAFTEHMHLQRGQKVFIPAGAGGIGTIAIQLAKQLGATVGSTTSAGNMALVRSLGADQVIDYRQQRFQDVLRDYDAVLGTVRGDGIADALQIVRPGSHVVSLVGPPDAPFAKARGMNVFMQLVFALMSHKLRRLAARRGGSYRFMFVRPDGAQLAVIARMVEAGEIRPVIDRVLPFAQAKEALDYLAQGRARGKVVLRMQDSAHV